jgi:hypothetical protein
MSKELNITNSQIVFSYSRNMNIRKRVFEFEESLKEQFNTPFRTVAIPDELDPNIPRFESQSKNKHSKLQVSQTRMTLATSFNNKLTKVEINEYLNQKRTILSGLANSEKINFIAYVIELNCYLPESKINSILKENTGVKALSDKTRDFSLLYSDVYKKNYYLNVKCSKFSEQEMIIQPGGKTIKKTSNIRHGISITLDLNSKLYFENKNKFNESLYGQIENCVFDLIKTKSLEDYLQGKI